MDTTWLTYVCPTLTAVTLLCGGIREVETVTEDAAYWRNVAREDILKYIENVPNKNVARNIILFIGDGLGLSTIMAARTLKGQLAGHTGEETRLAFETLPNVGLSKVYTTNMQVPDSAGTATAILTGVKTKSRIVGLDNTVQKGVCENVTAAKLTSVLHWAQAAGKSAGIVTTTRVTHATPAAAYASVPDRKWENDQKVPKHTNECTDIAHQLIHENRDIQVILGGGRRNFLPTSVPDPQTGIVDYDEQRHDGRNLITDWQRDKAARKLRHNYVWNKEQFDKVDPTNTDFLLGLFSRSHMEYDIERDNGPNGEPSLKEMTEKAIKILQRNSKGFFLLVEGGRIDHGHHVTRAKKALYDTLAFDAAVETALTMTHESDTLLVVTSDHSHVMTVAGYPERGNGILDKVGGPDSWSVDKEDHPYTTLSYANGPNVKSLREDLRYVDTTTTDYQQIAAVPLSSETHSGEDVPIYSRGPMSHLLTGVKEQNVIAYVMAHAACIGDTGVNCSHGRGNKDYSCDQLGKMCDTNIPTEWTNAGGQIGATSKWFYFIYLIIFLKWKVTLSSS